MIEARWGIGTGSDPTPSSTQERRPMDVTKLLEADHRTVEDLFARIDEAEGDDRQPLVDELVKALRAHMELEETVVYPAMEPVTGEEAVENGNKEHEFARE